MTPPADGARRLNLFDATMLVMGGVVGVGIFFTPQSVARLVPQQGPFFALWLLGGLIGLAGAMTFAELAGTFPRAGGWFVFLREAFGRFPAFLFAWIVLFVVSTGAVAVVADFCASQVAILAWGLQGAPPGASRAIGASILAGLTLVSLAGVKSGALLQNACMLLKLGALATLVGAAWLAFDPALTARPPAAATAAAAPAPPLLQGMVRAMLPVLFSYGGWQLITYIAPAVRDPQRTLPRAIVLGMAGVVIIYIAANASFVRVLGMEGLARDDVAARVAQATLGSGGGRFLVAAMAVSALGICAAIILASPWLYVAMAREGLFPAAFGRLSPRTGAPVAGLLVQGIVALLYFLWGQAALLTDAVVFAEWIFHALVGAALLLLRARRPDLPRPFRSWGYPLFPLVYTALAVAVVVGSLLQAERARTLLGLGVLAAGALVYGPWRRLFRAAADATT